MTTSAYIHTLNITKLSLLSWYIISQKYRKTLEKAFEYDLDNLIPVSDKAHREIHTRYKEEKLEDVQEELRAYIKAYAYGEVLRRRGY